MIEQQALSAYRRQRVETASPAQLIVMLYDACVGQCKAAQEAIAAGDRDRASRHLLKAQDIVAELIGALNAEAGGDLAVRLLSLYDYMYRRLVHANVHKDAAAAGEVARLLAGLREAWARVASTPLAASGASIPANSKPLA